VGVHQGWQALTGERLARSQRLLEQAGQRVDIDPMISVAVEKPFGAMYSSVPMVASVSGQAGACNGAGDADWEPLISRLEGLTSRCTRSG
jgi:hypothetical protein